MNNTNFCLLIKIFSLTNPVRFFFCSFTCWVVIGPSVYDAQWAEPKPKKVRTKVSMNTEQASIPKLENTASARGATAS